MPQSKRKSKDSGVTDNATTTPPKPLSRPTKPPFLLPLNVALYVSLIANGLAALHAPIQDCDEVYNFWEPTHYLDHGSGLQTWEYSPEYSIRSWLYVALHTGVGKLGLLFVQDKVSEFYFIRFFLAVVCAACQTRLYSSVCRFFSPRVGLMFLMIVAFSPGMFHASTALIPSSFTMYTSMLGLAEFLNWAGGAPKTASGIMWFGLGAIVGWPFAGALVVPLVLEVVALGLYAGQLRSVIVDIVKGGLRCVALLSIETVVDSIFFRKLTFVPWNIVAYNVFGGQGRGPDIFGTEPWTFYVRNLLLNFNVWFILALMAGPLLVVRSLSRSITLELITRGVQCVAPFYLWLAIFTAQPHKEERFMYPAYPFLCLSAAFSLHMILGYLGSSNPKQLVGRIPAKLKLTAVTACVLLAMNGGLLRTVGMITAYNAPLKVFEPLCSPEFANTTGSICLGKEWYRFPSSYFIPQNMRTKFIKSEFNGLLPGEFPESSILRGRIEGASRIPTGMNDLNQEDPEKYVDISECSFLIDSYFPDHISTKLEPNYILDEERWEKLSCHAFLDASRTGLVGRLIWIPELPIVPERFRRKWGEYCLLRRREAVSGDEV